MAAESGQYNTTSTIHNRYDSKHIKQEFQTAYLWPGPYIPMQKAAIVNTRTSHINFMLLIQCIFLHSIFFKNQQNVLIKINNIDHKTHFLSGANSYMFRHQGAIIRELLSNKGL